MTHPPLKTYAARRSPLGGFTLVELLVVIGIIAILAGVALGPITHGLETAKESAGMQTARTIALAEFQYQTDNAAYPAGATSGAVAADLVTGGYITDVSIFAKDKAHAYTGLTTTAAAISGGLDDYSTICWDFMAGSAATTGLTTSDPDGLPIIFSTGQSISVPATYSAATPIPMVPANNPFGNNGMAVCFKSNSASFLKAINNNGAYDVQTSVNNALFGPSFATGGSTYTQIKPE
jgi:prepilin-type N-terminal cleavage/methylation domain-containing protein